MGTSTPFRGNKNGNPLLPSWLDDAAPGGPPALPEPAPAEHPTPQPPPEEDKNPAQKDDKKPDPANPTAADPGGQDVPMTYFRPGRTLMNKRLRSGSVDRKKDIDRLSRSIGSFIRQGSGGARNASRRMSSSSGGAVARFGDVLFDAAEDGIRETVRRLNLDSLANRSLAEIYASLVDFVCGDGGDLEDSMNRDAYMHALEEVMAVPGIDLEKPSVDTINLLIERFIAGTIDNRVKNAIASGIVLLPKDIEQVKLAQADVRQFVGGAVKEAIVRAGKLFARSGIRETIDRVYEWAMEVLGTYGDDASGETT